MNLRPYAAPIAVLVLILLPVFSFPAAAQAPAHNCLSFDRMEGLGLANDATILVTMQDKTQQRVDLDQCAGLTTHDAFTFADTATALCEAVALPVTQAPAGCRVRKIADIDAVAVAALLTPPAASPAAPAPSPYDDMLKVVGQRAAEQEQPRTAVAFDPAQFAKFAGTYQIDLDVFVTVTRNGRRYFYHVTDEPAVEVFPESATKFFAQAVPVQVSFAPSGQGAGVDLTLHRDGQQILAKRVDKSVMRASQAALQRRIQRRKPDPAREALLRQYIAAEQSGEIPTDILSPRFLPLVAYLWPAIQQANRDLGTLKSLEFRRVTTRNADMYAAEYENKNVVWLVGSLTTDRKLVAMTSASGGMAESLEKVERLRSRLGRVQKELGQVGGPEPRASDRPIAGPSEGGDLGAATWEHPSVAWFDQKALMGKMVRDGLTDQRDEVLTHLPQAEQELRRKGDVTILPVGPPPRAP